LLTFELVRYSPVAVAM